MNFLKILIPIDFSPCSCATLDLGAYERKMEGTEITLLHAHCLLMPPLTGNPVPWEAGVLNEFNESYRKESLERLKDLAAAKFHGQSVSCESLVSPDGVAEQICDFADKNKFELVVMGSRGHTVLGALFLGSVVQRVLLTSKVPVLVVPPGAEKTPAK